MCWSARSDRQSPCPQGKEGQGADRERGLRVSLPAILLPRPQPEGGSFQQDQSHPQKIRSPHSGGSYRGDRNGRFGGQRTGCTGFLRSLRLSLTGSASMIVLKKASGYSGGECMLLHPNVRERPKGEVCKISLPRRSDNKPL